MPKIIQEKYEIIGDTGVSMVELAIVITIIGLLVAVVVGGRTIKKASEVRAIVSEVQQFQAGVENFRAQYQGLPGDLINMANYFAITRNGNGDGDVSYPIDGGSEIESLRAWQHLNLAGFVEGGYTGVATVGGQADIGINVPATKRDKAGYYLITDNLAGGTPRLELRVGAFIPNLRNDAAALSAQEAKSLDSKIDDGYPQSGSVLAATGRNITLESCRLQSGQDYRVIQEGTVCILAFPALP